MDYKKEFPIGTKVEITEKISQFERETPNSGIVSHYDCAALPIVEVPIGVEVYFDREEMQYLKKLDEFAPKLGDEIEYKFDCIPAWEKGFYVGKYTGCRHLVTYNSDVHENHGDFKVFHVAEIRPMVKTKEYTMEELATLAGVPLKDFKIKGEK